MPAGETKRVEATQNFSNLSMPVIAFCRCTFAFSSIYNVTVFARFYSITIPLSCQLLLPLQQRSRYTWRSNAFPFGQRNSWRMLLWGRKGQLILCYRCSSCCKAQSRPLSCMYLVGLMGHAYWERLGTQWPGQQSTHFKYSVPHRQRW